MKPATVINVSNAQLLAATAGLVVVGLLVGWFVGSLVVMP